MNNFPFVEYQAKKNKPMLISVGAANEDEIDRMIATVRKVTCSKFFVSCDRLFEMRYLNAIG